MSLATLQKKISTFPEEYFDEIDNFLNLLEFKVKALSAIEKQDAPQNNPRLSEREMEIPQRHQRF